MNSSVEYLKNVCNGIARAEYEALRPQGSVTLVAVSKTVSVDRIRPILEAGQRVFGENHVQEAQAKWPSLKDVFDDIKLHLIGPLQSNKAADAVALFDVIETVDRKKIVTVLAAEMKKQNRFPELYIQVNTGVEPQKAGIIPTETPAFLQYCRDVHGLVIKGLMCIPPVDENPGPHFALLEKIAGEVGVKTLSMGMSSDYETAIAFGATLVRIGSAIFGNRT